MNKSVNIVLCLCALTVTGALLILASKLSSAIDTAHVALWNISAAAYNSKPTLDHLNEATGVWSDASKKQAQAADEILRDIRAGAWHADRVMTTFNAQMEHVGPLLDSLRAESDALKETTHAATGTLTAATKTIQTVNDGTGPLLDASRASVKDFDALLRNPNIPDTLTNVQVTTQNIGGITLDLRKAADKATADYLKPVPWWKQPIKRFGEAWDIGAAFARHAP